MKIKRSVAVGLDRKLSSNFSKYCVVLTSIQ